MTRHARNIGTALYRVALLALLLYLVVSVRQISDGLTVNVSGANNVSPVRVEVGPVRVVGAE